MDVRLPVKTACLPSDHCPSTLRRAGGAHDMPSLRRGPPFFTPRGPLA